MSPGMLSAGNFGTEPIQPSATPAMRRRCSGVAAESSMPRDVLDHQPTIDVFSDSRLGAARIRLRVPLFTRLLIIVSGFPVEPAVMTRAAPLRNVIALSLIHI
jgi:hypothetical protein